MLSRIPSAVLAKLVGLATVAVVIVLGATTAAPPVRPVPRLDTLRYAGMWYELARLPDSLQARCIADATATYRPMDDGSMTVVRRCREAGDRWRVSVGRAVPVKDDRSGARMKVSFMPSWLSWLPSAQNEHWIVMVGGDYRYAVVSEPSRRHLWILSRTPVIDVDTYDGIVAWLRERKYPVEQLMPTSQRLQRSSPEMAGKPALIV